MSVHVCVTGSHEAVYEKKQANNICLNASLNESSVSVRAHQALKQNPLGLLSAQTEVKTIVC